MHVRTLRIGLGLLSVTALSTSGYAAFQDVTVSAGIQFLHLQDPLTGGALSLPQVVRNHTARSLTIQGWVDAKRADGTGVPVTGTYALVLQVGNPPDQTVHRDFVEVTVLP